MTKLGEDVKVLSLDQAVEDCTRCLDICEYLHENKGPSVSDARLKSLMRRAEAKSMLGRLYAPQPPCRPLGHHSTSLGTPRARHRCFLFCFENSLETLELIIGRGTHRHKILNVLKMLRRPDSGRLSRTSSLHFLISRGSSLHTR